MNQEKHIPELESIAAYRYQGMTADQLLTTLAVKMDQILVQITQMNTSIVDLTNRKADKTEITSWDVRLTALERICDEYKNQFKELKYRILGVAGGVGLVASIAVQVFNWLKANI